jgi:hypothetical protein
MVWGRLNILDEFLGFFVNYENFFLTKKKIKSIFGVHFLGARITFGGF